MHLKTFVQKGHNYVYANIHTYVQTDDACFKFHNLIKD